MCFERGKEVEPPRFGPRPDFHSFGEPKSGAVRPKVPCKEEYFLTKTKKENRKKSEQVRVRVRVRVSSLSLGHTKVKT